MKKRHYTLQLMGDSLCLTIEGKFLTQEFGLPAGGYYQFISQDNHLILLKTPKKERSSSPSKAELEEQERAKKLHKRKLVQLFPGVARTLLGSEGDNGSNNVRPAPPLKLAGV